MAEQDTELDMTQEELERIQTAMKNDDFRKMFAEYAREISDPENRKKYEEEIAQLEAERGMNVKFVHPQDGFVIKTGIKGEGGKKAFINICQSEAIAEPSSHFVNKKLNDQSVSGQQWSIPYILNKPKDDADKAGKKCLTYDMVFHTKTYKMGLEDPRFKNLIITTALDAVEQKWNVKLDRKNLKYPKLKFKGSKQSTIIRRSNNKGCKESGADIEFGDKKLPYPYKENATTTSKSAVKESLSVTENRPAVVSEGSTVEHNVTPTYSIVHRGLVDLQNFTNARDSRSSTRPQELDINIYLPLCESSVGIELDIFEKQLILDSADPLYHLDISLPYPVNEADGRAKFDKSKRLLIVTIPVIPSSPYEQIKHTDNELVNCEVAPVGPSSLADSEPCGMNGCDAANGDLNCVATENEMNVVENGDGDALTRMCVNHKENMVDAESEVTEVKADAKIDQGTTGLCEANEGHCGILQDTECPQGLSANKSKTVNQNSQTPVIACPFFKTPVYTFHQDSQSVTFILHVPNVSIESTSLGFNDNKCYINFPSSSLSSSTSLQASQEYALYIQFPDDCLVNTEKSKIDSNEKNLVLILFKQQGSVGLWDWFMIGSDEEKLERKLFLTETSLKESLEQSEDLWSDPSSFVTNHRIEEVCEDAVTIRLDVQSKATQCCNMGNILTANAEELLHGEVENIDDNDAESAVQDILNTNNMLSPLAELSIKEPKNSAETENDRGEDCDVFEPEEVGLDNVELNEVEVVEEKYEDEAIEESHHGLSTVQEVDRPEGQKNQEVSGADAELQRARAMKCKKNRRRRRSTGSHESSSSISEEEGEPGAGRKQHGRQRGKQARRLRKTRSLSFGSSAESHDDAENGPRSVRFNLVPEVRLFSNKLDKKKWKEIMRQQSLTEKSKTAAKKCKMKSSLKDCSMSETNGNSVEERSDDVGNAAESEADDMTSDAVLPQAVDGDASCDDPEKPQLTNSLMFDLDE